MTERSFSENLSREDLLEWLSYDSESGIFRWRKGGRGGRSAGQIAGSKMNVGYISIALKGDSYLAHRLAWLYFYGVWPPRFLDHVDGVRDNNAIANLRDCSRADNARNRGTSKGWSMSRRLKKRKYRAEICYQGKRIHLGCFATSEEARAAYLDGTKKYFGEFSPAYREAIS